MEYPNFSKLSISSLGSELIKKNETEDLHHSSQMFLSVLHKHFVDPSHEALHKVMLTLIFCRMIQTKLPASDASSSFLHHVYLCQVSLNNILQLEASGVDQRQLLLQKDH